MAKKKDEKKSIELCEGVELSEEFFEKKENRLFTLLLKGIIVYLFSMGAVGFYLSTIKAEYNVLLCHLVIFAFAIICSMLYYRLLTENLGYFVIFAIFAFLVYTFRIYINSGFYAILNITVDNAAQYFDVDIQKLYTEQISNRYVTITMIALFVGMVLDILLNVYISRRMKYQTAMFIVMFFNVIPLYMVLEPDFIYALMILAGISIAYVIKVNRHYSPQVSIKRNNNKFENRGKKKRELFYTYDVKAIGQAAILVFSFIAIVVTLVSTFKPKERFNVGYKQNKYKQVTMSAMSLFFLEGFEGFYRFSNYTGGMNSGKLGDVSSVKLDYQTDLYVKVAPYSYDTIYLRHFIGEQYNPYDNYWTSIKYFVDDYDEESPSPEAESLKKGFEENQNNSAYGKIAIRNVGGDVNGIYEPYYFGEILDNNENGYMIESFYPRLAGNKTTINKELYDKEPYSNMDLFVPEENRKVIEEFIKNFDTSGSNEEIIENLIDYYQEEIPYTIKPGKTPRKSDFVNYFLDKNKKGYCAHFASAATLVFRYLGIPARYVEGYAISYNQLMDADLLNDIDYSDYYKGYSEIGKTAVILVNVTDADAHAWVEVYDDNKGWYVVDVTPAGETEDVEDFWSMFDDIMDGNDEGTSEQGRQINYKISDGFVKGTVYVILAIMLLGIFIILVIRGIIYLINLKHFNSLGVNDRLIVKYSNYYKKLCKKNKLLKEKINYREQIDFIYERKINRCLLPENEQYSNYNLDIYKERIIDILERAGFSEENISEQDYNYILKFIN